MTNKEELNNFFVSCFYTILRAEEVALESITGGTLTTKEIHFIDAVFKAKAAGENCFSTIANFLGITLGTLTTTFLRLQEKGYLTKEQDAQDKRIYYIVPTQLAEFIHKEHTAFHEKMIDSIMHTLTEKEADNLIIALKKLDEFFHEAYKV